MTRRTLVLFALAAFTLLGSPASAKRAVIFRDPAYPSGGPLKSGAAFLLCDRIDIHTMVQDFVLGFDGDYAAGEAFTRSVLTDYLTGRRFTKPNTYSITSGTGLHLNLIDLRAAVPNVDVGQDVAATTDSIGVTSIAVSRPDSLKAVLASAHANYLIVIHGLRATREERSGTNSFLPDPSGKFPAMSIGGGPRSFVNLTGQALVFRADSMTLIWNGFVTGQHEIGRFRKSSAERVAEAFAEDLKLALELEKR